MELLREGAKGLGLVLDAGHLSAFERYYRELEDWNQRLNLTSVTGYAEVQHKHFLDSLTCLLALPQPRVSGDIPDTMPLQRPGGPLRVVDVGSGAGFPGLPLKIMLPEVRLTLIEATGKKTAFLQHIVAVLELADVQVLNARVEDVAHQPEHREQYDLVVARAVARLAVLAEYCLPLCRPGGRMVAQKGESAAEEAEEAARAIGLLGGAEACIKSVALPGVWRDHHLVVVDKVARTPEGYPRRVGVPAKRPLR
ncbi:MAG: 16S rRNA (guanine(527)-N(7))-methyltransferase RsmG [Chloroflexi bacterium]|nr:16S rRNA (guanine(527)-N(7))-methyltransferase RsmG [Chloroflexota bacterium]